MYIFFSQQVIRTRNILGTTITLIQGQILMELIFLVFLHTQLTQDSLVGTFKRNRMRQSQLRKGLPRIHPPHHPQRRTKHPTTVQSQRSSTLQVQVHQVETTLAPVLHLVIRQVQGTQPPILQGLTTHTVSIILLRLLLQQLIRLVVSGGLLKGYFIQFYTIVY